MLGRHSSQLQEWLECIHHQHLTADALGKNIETKRVRTTALSRLQQCFACPFAGRPACPRCGVFDDPCLDCSELRTQIERATVTPAQLLFGSISHRLNLTHRDLQRVFSWYLGRYRGS